MTKYSGTGLAAEVIQHLAKRNVTNRPTDRRIKDFAQLLSSCWRRGMKRRTGNGEQDRQQCRSDERSPNRVFGYEDVMSAAHSNPR
jgi:hypothetical protein